MYTYCRESSSTEFSQDFRNQYLAISTILAGLTNENGTTFTDLYPNSQWSIANHLYFNLFGDIRFALYLELLEGVYKEVKQDNFSMDIGSSTYRSCYSSLAEAYLYSGKYKQTFIDAFLEFLGYGTNVALGNQNRTDSVNLTYDEFSIEDSYFEIFDRMYLDVYGLVMKHASMVDARSDITNVATDYMK